MTVKNNWKDGPIEYKRQVNQSSSTRLRSLKTQMSFRLDQGHGTCMYRVGVEDDGCHSLLDYQVVAKSCCVLEYLARSLNSVVTERVMIQNEVALEKDGGSTHVKLDPSEAVRIREPTILGDASGRKDEISPQDLSRLQKGGFTRAELKIQKVETHALDPPPVPLSEVSDGPSKMDENSTAVNGQIGEAASSTDDQKSPNVGETMSSRNIRVAVVGNVDAGKSTLIGVSTDYKNTIYTFIFYQRRKN